MPTIQNYRTPLEIFNLAQELFGTIGIDVAASSEDALVNRYIAYYSELRNGLTLPWHIPAGTYPRVAWCNPPYDDQESWVRKAIEECLINKNIDRVVMLLPVNTGVVFWQEIIAKAHCICFITGRISYVNPTTGTRDAGNRHNSCFVVFDSSTIVKTLPVHCFTVDNPQRGRLNELNRVCPDQRKTGTIETTSIRTDGPAEDVPEAVTGHGVQDGGGCGKETQGVRKRIDRDRYRTKRDPGPDAPLSGGLE